MDPNLEVFDQIQSNSVAETENLTHQAQEKINQTQQEKKPPQQQTEESSTKIILNQKENFLVKYYLTSIFQYLGILAVFGIFQISEFSNLLVFKRHRYWWGQKFTYDDYKYQFNYHDKSYYDFLDWKNEQQNQNYEFGFRCTYIMIVILFSLLTLGITIARQYKCFVQQHQKKVFYFQTAFIGLILGGFAAESRNTWKYPNKISFIIWAIVLLVANATTTIILVKIRRLHYHKNIGKTSVYLFLPINWLIGINQGELKQSVPIFQSIVIYCLYYFSQLNQSMLSNETPNGENITDTIKTWLNELRQEDKNEDQVAKNQLKQRYFILDKRLILSMLSVFGASSLLIISLFIKVQLFLGLLIVIVSSAASFFIETQVHQNNLQEKDVFITVCSTYLDFLIPIKIIIRSFKNLLK